MAIPMQQLVVPPTLQHPLLQHPSQQALHPSMELLAAMDGWDPLRMYGISHLGAPLGAAASPLEGAGRMGQGGGVMSRSMPAQPSAADLGGGGHYISGSRGTAERRSLLEVNHNKAITKKLVSAVHYQQVLDCVGHSVGMFDEVNVATALHRLAKLQPPGPGGHPSPIIYADQFQQLVEAVGRLLPQFEAQALSNTMWAFATLSYYPENNLLDRLANHAVSIISTFRPQATSNTLWAYAKLGYCPCKALLNAGARQMLQDLSKCVPQDVSNTLWAFAALRHHPGAELMDRAARQAVVTMQRFKPQELANTLWSFASLGHDPSNQLLDTMAIQMVARIQGFRPQAVSNSLWSYAKLGYNPGILLLDVAAQKAAGMLHQYTSQELANTVWALATLEHHPGASMLNSAATQIARRMDQFSPQDVSNAIWAMAQLTHNPGKEMLQGVAHYALRHWAQMKTSEAVKTLGALAQLSGCNAATWEPLLAKLGATNLSSFQETDLQQIYQMHQLIKASLASSGECLTEVALNADLLAEAEHAWRRMVQKKAWLSPMHKAVSLALWRLGIVHQDNHLTPDGLFCVDIALDGTNIVVEVQEAAQFAANCRLYLGRTTARHALLEASGLIVCKVPHFEWALCTTQEQQQHYLSSLVSTCALAAAPRFPTALASPVSHAPAQSQAAVTLGFPISAPLGSGILPFGGSMPPITQGLGASIFGVSPNSSRLSPSSSGFDMSSLERAL